jgi:protein-tyrosine phosphatase
MEDAPATALYLNWLDLAAAPAFAGVTGRFGMTLLPGRQFVGRITKQPRDIERDAQALATLGVDVFVLLVEDHELIMCGVSTFVAVLAAHKIQVIRCPIIDGQTPRDRSSAPRPLSGPGVPAPGDVAAFTALVDEIKRRLWAGQTIGVSCRGGLGRTGLLAACLLKRGGLDAETAIAMVRQRRPGAIENAYQAAFVRAW